jgi:hypothetical protein
VPSTLTTGDDRVVCNEMNRADLEAGMRTLTQEYQENIAAKTRANLTMVERLRSELTEEYRRNHAQNRTGINAQLRDDHEAARRLRR